MATFLTDKTERLSPKSRLIQIKTSEEVIVTSSEAINLSVVPDLLQEISDLLIHDGRDIAVSEPYSVPLTDPVDSLIDVPCGLPSECLLELAGIEL